MYSEPILSAVTPIVAVPGELGERAAETEAALSRLNFKLPDETKNVPADKLIGKAVPFCIRTVPLDLSPIVFVPVVALVFSPSTSTVISWAGIIPLFISN